MKKMVALILIALLWPIMGEPQIHNLFKESSGMNEERYRNSKICWNSMAPSLERWRSQGPCWAVAVKGNYAYIGNGELLQVLDVSNPSSPQVVCERCTGGEEVLEVVLSGDYLYVGVVGWLIVYDVSKPDAPWEEARLEIRDPDGTKGALQEIVISGHYAYVYAGSLCVIDIEDPAKPRLVSKKASGGLGPHSLAIYGHYLYYGDATPNGGVNEFWDISDPTNPQEICPGRRFGDRVLDLAVRENYLFVADLTTLWIEDLINPLGPEIVGVIDFAQVIRGIHVSERLVYITFAFYDTSSLSVVDISDPTHPTEIGYVKDGHTTEYLHLGVFLSFPFIYAACYDGLWIVDVREPTNPKEVYFFPTLPTPVKIETPDKSSNLQKSFQLYPNYPNPFNGTTNIHYELFEPGQVTLEIFDMLGEKVATLVHEKQNAGQYEVPFDGNDLPSMIYLCRLCVNKQTEMRKMIFAK